MSDQTKPKGTGPGPDSPTLSKSKSSDSKKQITNKSQNDASNSNLSYPVPLMPSNNNFSLQNFMSWPETVPGIQSSSEFLSGLGELSAGKSSIYGGGFENFLEFRVKQSKSQDRRTDKVI